MLAPLPYVRTVDEQTALAPQQNYVLTTLYLYIPISPTKIKYFCYMGNEKGIFCTAFHTCTYVHGPIYVSSSKTPS
jgi:hypothetical protein